MPAQRRSPIRAVPFNPCQSFARPCPASRTGPAGSWRAARPALSGDQGFTSPYIDAIAAAFPQSGIENHRPHGRVGRLANRATPLLEKSALSWQPVTGLQKISRSCVCKTVLACHEHLQKRHKLPFVEEKHELGTFSFCKTVITHRGGVRFRATACKTVVGRPSQRAETSSGDAVHCSQQLTTPQRKGSK